MGDRMTYKSGGKLMLVPPVMSGMHKFSKGGFPHEKYEV